MAKPLPRGSGHPNILRIEDFGSPVFKTFKVETEIPRTTKNGKKFDKLWQLVGKKNRKKADDIAIVAITDELVGGLGTAPKLAGAAKLMFKAAFEV